MQRATESGTPGGTSLPFSFRLQTAQDVISLLGEQIEAIVACCLADGSYLDIVGHVEHSGHTVSAFPGSELRSVAVRRADQSQNTAVHTSADRGRSETAVPLDLLEHLLANLVIRLRIEVSRYGQWEPQCGAAVFNA
jgi:hypothetical protein